MPITPARHFEAFVADLFAREGFQAAPNIAKGMREADIILTSPSGATAVVEIKLYASRSMPMSVMSRAAYQVEELRKAFGASKAILVVGGRMPTSTKSTLEKQNPNLVIYDVDVLAFIAAKHTDLLRQLEEFTRETFVFSDAISPMPVEVDIQGDLQAPLQPVADQPEQPEAPGKSLCEKLSAIPEGKSGFKDFELTCTEILKYVFDKDLTAWSAQQGTETGISYYDLIARVASSHDFWLALVHQFRSRYVIFEFKNYKDEIGQGQIYTTEKYLFQTALRSTAFIISRRGADTNGLAAARGALREHGKLIVNLTIDDLCQMLKLKDTAGDPSSILVNIVDQMLIKLER